ncbi:MAG: hypothetical protein P4M11_08355 [Candidatus Pacebacteria bacterium]|nr:hypothetical protein [Candidatus Paceibacterota bacterium]
MEDSQLGSLIEGHEKALQHDPHIRTRCLITFFLQIIPWALFVAILLLESIIKEVIGIGDDDRDVFKVICISFAAILVVIAVMGFFVSLRNMSPAIGLVLLLVFYALFLLAAIGYVTFEVERNLAVYAWIVGLPFLVLAVGNFLAATFVSMDKHEHGYTVVIWVLAIMTPTVVLVLDEATHEGTDHPYILCEILADTAIHAILAASWCTAVRFSVCLAYFWIRFNRR